MNPKQFLVDFKSFECSLNKSTGGIYDIADQLDDIESPGKSSPAVTLDKRFGLRFVFIKPSLWCRKESFLFACFILNVS